jgi:hypothetical protein
LHFCNYSLGPAVQRGYEEASTTLKN